MGTQRRLEDDLVAEAVGAAGVAVSVEQLDALDLHVAGPVTAVARDRGPEGQRWGQVALLQESVAIRLLAHLAQVDVDRALCRPDVRGLPLDQQECPIAHAAHGVRHVADEEERHAALPQPPHPGEALLLEAHVADRENLVEDEDVRAHRHRDREGEPRVHAARVGLHRLVDELSDVGERRNLVEPLPHLAPRDAEDRAVQEDVLAARELRVEAASQLEERRHAAAHLDPTFARDLGTRDDLEERALAGPVASDDTQRLPGPDLDRHAPQRPKVRVVRLPASEESLFQPVLRLRVHLVALADVPQRDRGGRTRPDRRGRPVAVRRHRRIPASSS